ncbi:MAG: hypothetical protein AB1486_23075 [Planctomycetota bacterium]
MRTSILAFTILLFLGLSFVFFTAEAPIEEDAYISFRHVLGLYAGNGIGFNIGENEESYSNLLWILMLAALHGLGTGIPLAAYILGMLSAMALIAYLHFRVHPIAALLLASCVPFLHWSQHGLETVFYALLVTVGTIEMGTGSTKRQILATSMWMLAVFTRPEAPILFGALALAGLYRVVIRRDALRPWLLSFILMAVALGGLEAWRLLYHGDPFPNPFYSKQVKTSLSPGFAYTYEFFFRSKLWYLLAFPLAYMLAGGRGDRRFLFTLAVLVGQFVFVILEGGDQMSKPYFRFFVPILPLFFAAACWCLETVIRRGAATRPLLRGAVLAVLGLGLASFNALAYVNRLPGKPQMSYGAFTESLQRAVHNQTNWREMKRFFSNPDYMPSNFHTLNARWIREHTPPGSVIAHDQMGQTPFYAGLEYTFIDLFGLCTRGVAKVRYAHDGSYFVPEYGEYVFGRNPDYIMSYTFGHLHALGLEVVPNAPLLPPTPQSLNYKFLCVVTDPRGGRTTIFARRDHHPDR